MYTLWATSRPELLARTSRTEREGFASDHGCYPFGDGSMTRGIPVRLVVAWLCSLAAFPLVVAAAADENHPGLSFDADSRAAGGGQWTIVATYSIPEGASGLAYDGTFLYCGIYGSNGNEIYQIDPDTGLYTLLFTGPQEDAFELTYDGQYLWTTDHSGSPSTPAIAVQMDWSGAVLTNFDLPAH